MVFYNEDGDSVLQSRITVTKLYNRTSEDSPFYVNPLESEEGRLLLSLGEQVILWLYYHQLFWQRLDGYDW